MAPHNQATEGAGDDHARMTSESPFATVGLPDAFLELNGNLVGIIELKSFWNVTEQAILQVLREEAPLAGDHHDRLAIELAYGYLFHNSVVYGIISTVNSFAFLKRETGGKLNLTRLFPVIRTDPTILMMLYYFSHLCAITPPLVEAHLDGRPITVIRAQSDSSTAPMVPLPDVARATSSSSLSHIQLDAPRRSPRFQQNESTVALASSKSYISQDRLYLEIDIRAPGTWLGCKGYKGVLHTGEIVVAKLWDGWKHSSEEADREGTVYESLRDLWGTIVPKLIAHGCWGFCHIVVLELIKGAILSDVVVTPRIERNVVKAFKELHQRHVYHGDVRAANIIVRPDDSVVLIDLERSVLNADRMMLLEEEDEVRHMLQIAAHRIS